MCISPVEKVAPVDIDGSVLWQIGAPRPDGRASASSSRTDCPRTFNSSSIQTERRQACQGHEMSDSSTIVQKLWNFCNVLRDDGLSYQDYLEQLVTLLFLKMAEERTELTGAKNPIPAGYRWSDLAAPAMEGALLEEHYRKTLIELGKSGGMLGIIFRKAQNKIQDPAKLRQLIVELIGKEAWTSMSSDVKGDAYEGLLEKNAEDTKSGAGQYFTPRALIDALVDCIVPRKDEVICDPACGTGGFLLSAYHYLATHYELDLDQKRHLRYDALRGVELVDA